MSMIADINWITVILAGLFLIPVIVGIVSPFSSARMQRRLGSLLNGLIFLAALLLAVYVTGLVLKNPDSPFLAAVYKVIPAAESLLKSQDIWVWIIFDIVLTMLISGILLLVTMPLYRYVIVPATDSISAAMGKMNGVLKRFLGAIWELPRAAALVLAFSLLLNLYSGMSSNSPIKQEINRSEAYEVIDATILEPILSSGFVKQIPVLLNSTFQNAAATLEERNIRLTRYFNGMTLGDAVKSNADIDTAARRIAGKETDDAAKAKLLYGWICKNITYDDQKAAAVAADSSHVSSGAVVAFNTKKGICFDYACLYVAMCRAVDVKVRFITGLGYGGTEWGDHAWNQIYSTADKGWINIDTTFGSSGRNYFDSAHFDSEHRDAVIQGEW